MFYAVDNPTPPMCCQEFGAEKKKFCKKTKPGGIGKAWRSCPNLNLSRLSQSTPPPPPPLPCNRSQSIHRSVTGGRSHPHTVVLSPDSHMDQELVNFKPRHSAVGLLAAKPMSYSLFLARTKDGWLRPRRPL